MKRALLFLMIEFILSLIACLTMNGWSFDRELITDFGLANIIIGVLCLFIGVILSIARKESSKPMLISSCLLLLMGFLTCSVFPVRWGNQ
jgi:hypothetical protein